MHYYRWIGGSSSGLWENREALDKYLQRLKELMEADERNVTFTKTHVMPVKAKFRCNSTSENDYGSGSNQKEAKFMATYGKEGENADYSKATPSGQLSITIDKETAAFDFFKPGKSYYLTFEEAPE